MPLTNCSQCRYLDRHPHHKGDVVCGVAPHYASMWHKLQSLDEYTKETIPVDFCREFELHPDFEAKELTLTLSLQEWKQLASTFSNPKLLQQLKGFGIEPTSTTSSHNLISRNHTDNIDPRYNNQWISVDSSCIDAIAYSSYLQVLKIRFHSERVYEYSHFPVHHFDEFLNARSKGRFFNLHIKDRYTVLAVM